jgi:hypothetical protein
MSNVVKRGADGGLTLVTAGPGGAVVSTVAPRSRRSSAFAKAASDDPLAGVSSQDLTRQAASAKTQDARNAALIELGKRYIAGEPAPTPDDDSDVPAGIKAAVAPPSGAAAPTDLSPAPAANAGTATDSAGTATDSAGTFAARVAKSLQHEAHAALARSSPAQIAELAAQMEAWLGIERRHLRQVDAAVAKAAQDGLEAYQIENIRISELRTAMQRIETDARRLGR